MTWIDRNGGDSKSVTFVEIPLAEQGAAVKTGRVDASMMIEPWVSEVENDVRVLAKPYDSLGKEIMISGWITSRSWVQSNAAIAGVANKYA